MPTIAEQILAETEYQENGIIGTPEAQKQAPKRENGKHSDPDLRSRTGNGKSAKLEAKLKEKTEQAIFDINVACDHSPKPLLAFSGGSDSLVLLDLLHRGIISGICKKRPYVIWIDSQMEYKGTREFIKETVERYNLDLRIAKAQHTPQEQWRRTGWPMLGKQAARLWMQKNRGQGFAINVSECCRALKIRPARNLTKNLGCSLQITGQRGQRDDSIRGLRHLKDGKLFYQNRDRIWIANPLTGWTDEEIKAYIKERRLTEHPARAKGARTIGCIYCGGGSQYTNSGFRVLRFVDGAAWKSFIIDNKAGIIILALKYKQNLFNITQAIQEAGGLEHLSLTRPWVFDFTRKTPLKGYTK